MNDSAFDKTSVDRGQSAGEEKHRSKNLSARDNVSQNQTSQIPKLTLKKKKKETCRTRMSSATTSNLLIPPSIMEENVHNLVFSPVKVEKYFGSNARLDFLNRINVAHQDETIRGNGYLPSKEESTPIPFMPRRPVKSSDRPAPVSVASLGDVSCLSWMNEGYDDRPGLGVEAPSVDTITSFDYQTTSDYERNQPSSPRTTYISGCIQEKLNPRASLLLRKSVSQELNLQHQGKNDVSSSSLSLLLPACNNHSRVINGIYIFIIMLGMGDAMGVIFAKSLENMPFLEWINLTDNNLTGKSLHAIIDAFHSLHTLTHLNLSCNEIDRPAAAALATYVAGNATLSTLILSQADLDDYECKLFVVAAAENATLTELDLSNNEIGKSEISPVLKAQNGSGPESLASLLNSGECRIRTLSLRWNQVRLSGGIALVDSLKLNASLLHLDLAYNSLGNVAAEILGSALLCNKTITTLNLENNNIQGSGCFTLCIGILENNSLTSVCLDTNPVGEFGSVMLMQLPLDVGHRVKISAKNCTFVGVAAKEALFDHSSPAAEYELLLRDPFQRSIGIR